MASSVQVRFLAAFGDGEDLLGSGSGSIIGPNLVLTCAHNVYKRETGIQLDKSKTTFYLSVNGVRIEY
jgi:hypothetical protein